MGTRALAAARRELQPALPTSRAQVRKVLLVCGIISSLLYVGTDFFAAMIYDGCSYSSQTVSELIAIGAPT